jgi:hypothetical protein
VANKRPDISLVSTKCGACGNPDHVWSICTAFDAKVLKCTLAKRKHITECRAGPNRPSHPIAQLASEVIAASDTMDADAGHFVLDDITVEYDDTEVRMILTSVSFTSTKLSLLNLSDF